MRDRNASIAVGLHRLAVGLAVAAAVAAGGSRPLFAAETRQKHFATPEAAADALAAAVAAKGNAALIEILGPKGKPIVDSGDPVADASARERFEQAYAESHSIEKSGEEHATLDVGGDRWPFPVPMLKEAAGWRFDTDAGDHEILARRIGRNELATIQTCLAYVDAQREYYLLDPDGDSLLQSARRFASKPGKHDGLSWETKEGEPPSPLGPVFAGAKKEGYALGSGKGEPYHGYHYRILTSQGSHAKGGAYDYLVGDALFGGFAMVAWPASWGASGVMTFLVNHDGVVFEKDLGPDTEKTAAAIQRFDPDPTWKAVPDDGQ